MTPRADPSILWPVCALAALTFMVLMVLPFRRFGAAFAGLVTARDFKYGESVNVPGHVAVANRNYANLFESPVLFYVACLAFYVTQLADARAVTLAWVYVAVRVVHSIVHLTYNNVYHRFVVFSASVVVLAILWVDFALALRG